MYCIESSCSDVYFSLAAEEYLLKRKQGNYFMLWQSKPSVVIGKHQSIDAEVDADFAGKHGINIARRFSGGGAVYHDMGNVNITFIESIAQPDFEYYLQQTVDFLSTLGIAAHTDERMGIYIDRQKISGSAQCIHKNRVMYHCTLLFSTDLEKLNASLRGKSVQDAFVPGSRTVRAIPSVRSEVTNICKHLQQPHNVKRFMRLAFHYFLDSDEKNRIYHFSQADIEAIECLKREKYANEEWIYNKAVLKNTLS